MLLLAVASCMTVPSLAYITPASPDVHQAWMCSLLHAAFHYGGDLLCTAFGCNDSKLEILCRPFKKLL